MNRTGLIIVLALLIIIAVVAVIYVATHVNKPHASKANVPAGEGGAGGRTPRPGQQMEKGPAQGI